jgi:hypothetical protein
VARTTSRPGDLTGRKREELVAEHAQELSDRADEIGLVTATKQAALLNEVTDLTQTLPTQIPVEELEEQEVDEEVTFKIITLVEDLENVTIGAGNLYTFEAGKKYKVPANVADHLTEKGYVR